MNGKGYPMTKDEIYRKYIEWANGAPGVEHNELFGKPAVSCDVYEDHNTVINHLYFLLVRRVGEKTSPFVFYEENVFEKLDSGDMRIVKTCYRFPQQVNE